MKPQTEELVVEPDRDAGIVKMLDLSTAHTTAHDGELLTHCAANRGRAPLVVIQDEYRWIVYTWLSDESESQAKRDQELKALGMSEVFIELLAYARRLGCKWVMLDCDADQLPGLPTFDW